ncbi:hypothetical protein M3Y98_00713600 [Aphelenchoides besseyi]|nr:hypothetical protein M3Y98_00713600 [Aphelenchoides besseyi]
MAWSEEAQAAYKLLVQCGDQLQRTSPIEARIPSAGHSPRSQIASSSTDSTIIRTYDVEEQIERCEIEDQRQPIRYENCNADQPPLPPKPKAR